MRKIALFLGVFSVAAIASACGGESAPAKDPSIVASAEATTSTTAGAAPSTASDIVDTAVAAGQFSTLAAALKAADLVDALKGPGPFTVFAPTDDAFKKLPPGTVENLLRPENKAKLQAVLKYHVVSGKVMAADAAKLSSAKTLQGAEAKISAGADGVFIDKAKIVKTDIACSNGVIHVIDAVILPPG